MDSLIHTKILQLLDEHRIMTLATLRLDGWPQATTVGYVNEGLKLYFLCGRDSQKARNLAHDNRVSLTIDHDVAEPMLIRGLSMAGHTMQVTDAEWIRQAMMTKVLIKYPEYSSIIPNINFADRMVFGVEPTLISVLDYSLGFGHCDLVEVASGDLRR